jgi:serine phosphatase RsbU (regulator of sigma subunit)/putative methionine-R-sulfoxide reductase with GAF domain
MKSRSAAHSAVRAYSVLIGLAGLAALALTLPHTTLPPWTDALALLIVSTCVKRMGFHVITGVTHSLVGILDLAVLFLFGGPSAGLLAGLAAAITQWSVTERTPGYTASIRLLETWYVGGLRALILISVGALYQGLGGQVPLGILTWDGFARVLAASCALFLLDHAAWWLGILLKHGWSGAFDFLRRISNYSLIVELAPLPASVLLAEIYQTQSGPAILVMLMALVAAGLMLRRLIAALDEERRRVRELSLMSDLGRDLLRAGPEPEAIYALLHHYLVAIAPVRGFAVQVPDSAGTPILTFCLLDGESVQPSDIGDGLYRTVTRLREPLFVNDLASVPYRPLRMGFAAQSGAYLPVEVGGELFAVISLQHDKPDAFGPAVHKPLVAATSQAAQALRAANAYANERKRAAHLMAVAEVGRRVAAILDLDTLFEDTVGLVHDTFGYHCVSLFTVDQESKQVAFRASSNATVQERGVNVAWGQGIVGWAAEKGEPAIANRVSQDSRFVGDPSLAATRSEVAVPLKVEERILGVMDVQSDEDNAFGSEELVALGALSDLVAIAIEDSRIYQEGQEQAWVSTALLQVAESVAHSNTREEILDSVVRLVEMLTGVDRCLVYLWSEQDEVFELVEGSGIAPEQMEELRGRAIPSSEAYVLATAVKTGERAQGRVSGLGHIPGWEDQAAQHDGEVIALPLRAGGEVVGVLVAEQLEGRGLPWKHRETILAGAADYAGMALENARLNASLREEAWASTALLQVATMLSASPDVDEVLTTVVRLTPLLVSVDWCVVLLWDEDQQRFAIARGHAVPAEIEEAIESEPSAFAHELLQPLVTATEHLDASFSFQNAGGQAELQRVTAHPLRTWDRLLGAFLVGGEAPHRTAPEHRMGILAGVANQLTLAIESARLHQQSLEQERLHRSIELAREIQESFLPECCPEPEGWDLAAEWRAARGVGGDFYDFIPLPDDRLGLVIADVSDKGVGAALYMALSRAVLRAAALTTADPAETLRRANRVLMDDARSGMFVTVFYAVVCLATGEIRYARAGHNPGLLYRARTGEAIDLRPAGVVLGILDDPQLEESVETMEPGDLLLLYTDGVIEAVNEKQQEYGRERLVQALKGCGSAPAEEVLERIDASLHAFVEEQPQADDITLIVTRRSHDLGPGEPDLA